MKRKRNRLLYCFAGVACIAMALILAFASPRANNGGHEPVALSKPSGFYDEPFSLELSGGGRIFYTLDSTEPDENAIPYTGPIWIEDASAHENVYSMIRDVALDLNEELLVNAGFKLKYNYKLPESPVDKATVIRAVCVYEDGRRSDVVNGVYFVGFDEKDAYDGMNIVSITTDPENLFDDEKGIYVLGKAFRNTLVDGFITMSPQRNYAFISANYWKKGREWERPCSVCFFDTDRNLVLSGDYGVRIQGRGSRAMLPKSLNLFARSEYGSSAIPCQPLLGIDCELASLNLNIGGNGSDVMLHDYLANELCDGLNVATREYEPYMLFLDGEFWGVYWLTPKFKGDYIQYKYGVHADNQLVIKVGNVEVGQEEDEAIYDSMVSFISGNDMSDPALYARACELVDIESCVDYYATELFIVNTDWPKYNVSLWRSKDAAAGAYADCKWRWILFDVNIAMNPVDAELDCVRRTINRDPLFASLMDSEAFSSALYARMVDLAETVFAPDRVNRFIDDYEQMMAGPMEKEYTRFYNGEKTRDDFIRACEDIRTFFLNRGANILREYGGSDEQESH